MQKNRNIKNTTSELQNISSFLILASFYFLILNFKGKDSIRMAQEYRPLIHPPSPRNPCRHSFIVVPSFHVPRDFPFLPYLERKPSFGAGRDVAPICCLPTVGEVGRRISFRSGLSKFCLDSSLPSLRARGLLLATVM
jgi:hypothetical protein